MLSFAHRSTRHLVVRNNSAQQSPAVSQNKPDGDNATQEDSENQSASDTNADEASDQSNQSDAPIIAPVTLSENPLKGRTISVSKGCVQVEFIKASTDRASKEN